MPSLQSTPRLRLRTSLEVREGVHNPLPSTYQFIHNNSKHKTLNPIFKLNLNFLLTTSHKSSQIRHQRYFYDPMTKEILIETILRTIKPDKTSLIFRIPL